MKDPNFVFLNENNYMLYGLEDEEFEILKERKRVVIGTFIQNFPLVFSSPENADLGDFLKSSITAYHNIIKEVTSIN